MGGDSTNNLGASDILLSGELLASRYTWANDNAILASWPRFVAKVAAFDPCGCWLWCGARTKGGHRPGGGFYGSVWCGGTGVRAHIFAWIASGGELPLGWHLDHLCRNTLCVNPLHLEPVTAQENLRRQWLGRHALRLAA